VAAIEKTHPKDHVSMVCGTLLNLPRLEGWRSGAPGPNCQKVMWQTRLLTVCFRPTSKNLHWICFCLFHEFDEAWISQFELSLHDQDIIRLDVRVPPGELDKYPLAGLIMTYP
jgi:hypothetical protein